MGHPAQVLLGQGRVLGCDQAVAVPKPEPAALEAVQEGHHQRLVREKSPHVRLVALVQSLEDGEALPVALDGLEVHPVGLHVSGPALFQLIQTVVARHGDEQGRQDQTSQNEQGDPAPLLEVLPARESQAGMEEAEPGGAVAVHGGSGKGLLD